MTLKHVRVPLGPNGEKDINDHRNLPREELLQMLDVAPDDGVNATFTGNQEKEPTMAEPGPLDWLSKYELTDAEADELSDPNFIIPDLIIDGHIVAIVGKGGSGRVAEDAANTLKRMPISLSPPPARRRHRCPSSSAGG